MYHMSAQISCWSPVLPTRVVKRSFFTTIGMEKVSNFFSTFATLLRFNVMSSFDHEFVSAWCAFELLKYRVGPEFQIYRLEPSGGGINRRRTLGY